MNNLTFYLYFFIYSLCLQGVMNSLLVTHLPMLVAMVAKFSICKRKLSNFIFYYLFIYLFSFIVIFILLFINNQGKQHKLLKK